MARFQMKYFNCNSTQNVKKKILIYLIDSSIICLPLYDKTPELYISVVYFFSTITFMTDNFRN